MLSEKHIKQFQKIYKEHFGTDLTKEQAYDKAINIIQLFKIIYKPDCRPILKSDNNKIYE